MTVSRTHAASNPHALDSSLSIITGIAFANCVAGVSSGKPLSMTMSVLILAPSWAGTGPADRSGWTAAATCCKDESAAPRTLPLPAPPLRDFSLDRWAIFSSTTLTTFWLACPSGSKLWWDGRAAAAVAACHVWKHRYYTVCNHAERSYTALQPTHLLG